MTSRPLFASVAESIVILAPILQVGWRRASAGVTAARVLRARRGTGRRTRSGSAPRPAIDSPTRHCQIAECSESIGRSQASGLANGSPGRVAALRGRARASGMTRWPPATRVSLLAVATTLPARRAASTGPQADDAAGRDDDEVDVVAGRELDERRRRRRSGAVPAGRSSARPPRRRPRLRRAEPAACSASSGRVRARPRARRPRNASGCAARTSSAWRPDRPGRAEERDPRTRRRGLSETTASDIQGHDGRREQERVDPVEHAAVARDEGPESLAPAARLSIDSARSPAWAASARAARGGAPDGGWPSPTSTTPTTTSSRRSRRSGPR